MSNETVARYPFSLTVHMKNGTPLYLDRAIHLNGDWEMCLSQLYLPRSEVTVFSDCKIEFRYELLPKQSPKTEKDRLWNDKLKRLRENEKKQTITISIAAGTYDTEIIIELINQAIQDNEDLQTYRQKTKLVLSNGKNFFREIPKVIDVQGRTAFQLQEEIKSIGISRELAYLLGFVNHPKHGIPFITMNNSSKHALLSTHQRPPNGGIFYYFLYCDLIEYQSIGNQRAPLLRITPAVENITSNVKSIQFEHLYYYRVSKDIITHIVPEIRSEFGELVQFKHTDPLYVFHFRPRVYEIL